jgi:hypothetical protein
MTDPTGSSFLSYRRSRVEEARLLIEAQHDVGIPTWQDLSALEHDHTEQQLLEVLAEETTANALFWITPDVETSPVITRVELPSILRRVERRDGFFLVPVAAGRLDYGDVPRVVGTFTGLHDLGQWNIHKVTADPISATDAAVVARRILSRRLEEIIRQTPAGVPLRIVLNTRKKPAFLPGVALSLDFFPPWRRSRRPSKRRLPDARSSPRVCAHCPQPLPWAPLFLRPAAWRLRGNRSRLSERRRHGLFPPRWSRRDSHTGSRLRPRAAMTLHSWYRWLPPLSPLSRPPAPVSRRFGASSM